MGNPFEDIYTGAHDEVEQEEYLQDKIASFVVLIKTSWGHLRGDSQHQGSVLRVKPSTEVVHPVRGHSQDTDNVEDDVRMSVPRSYCTR